MEEPKGKLKAAYETIARLQSKVEHLVHETNRAKEYLELDNNKNYLAIQVLENILNIK